jgi:hypothetical protein
VQFCALMLLLLLLLPQWFHCDSLHCILPTTGLQIIGESLNIQLYRQSLSLCRSVQKQSLTVTILAVIVLSVTAGSAHLQARMISL